VWQRQQAIKIPLSSPFMKEGKGGGFFRLSIVCFFVSGCTGKEGDGIASSLALLAMTEGEGSSQ